MTELRLIENTPKKLNETAQFIFYAFVPVWNERYPNQKYFLSGQDAKIIKEFLRDNPGIMDDFAEIQSRASLYIKDDWWAEQRHPAWGLVRHFNRYIPEAKKEVRRYLCKKCKRDIPRTIYETHDQLCPYCEG